MSSTLDPENFPSGRQRKTLKGHDVRALGPCDSSDTGADMAGQGPLDDTTGLQIAELDPVEGLALARLDELVFDNRARVAIDHHLQPTPELVGAVRRHRYPVSTPKLRGRV